MMPEKAGIEPYPFHKSIRFLFRKIIRNFIS